MLHPLASKMTESGEVERTECEDVEEDHMIEEIASDFSEYFKVNSEKEKEKFNETVEEMLTKLEEFCSLVDMIRGDNTLCLTETLPKIQSKCSEMQEIFHKVDKLEAFVAVVKDSIGKMEECVNKAEDDMGSFSGLKKMLSSFVGPKKTVTKGDKKASSFTPPPIFKTNDFFSNDSPSTGNQTVPTEKKS